LAQALQLLLALVARQKLAVLALHLGRSLLRVVVMVLYMLVGIDYPQMVVLVGVVATTWQRVERA
jgi:hypothetical protein